MYKVKVLKKALKRLDKMPPEQQDLFYLLKGDIEEKGPVQADWPNYSKLSKYSYHCHLSISWVAVWSYTKGSVEVEVYYVGSRENAPY